MNSINQELVNWFLNNPINLRRGIKQLKHRRKGNTVEEIIASKKEAHRIVRLQTPSVREAIRKIKHLRESGADHDWNRREAEFAQKYADIEDQFEQTINMEKGTASVKFILTEEALNDQQIYKECKMDPAKWKLVQVWQKKRSRGFAYSANFKLILPDSEERLKEDFTEFLKHYNFTPIEVKKNPPGKIQKPAGYLIFNKQDFHFDRYDFRGDNDVDNRFQDFFHNARAIVKQASVSYDIQKIYYVIGSDQFNSEWTLTTTKGTPQTNIMHHTDAFNLICNHEVSCIQEFGRHADNVEVIHLLGNHDTYASFYLAKFLEAFFRQNKNVSVDSTHQYRKYRRIGRTGVLFNHGDAIKPKDLALIFPKEFKHEWANCERYMILTGDKHSEKSDTFHGTKWYSLPAHTSTSSEWEQREGHVGNKGEITAFLLTNRDLHAIYKRELT